MAQHFADYNSAFCGKRSLFLATVFAVSRATTQLGIASLTILYIVMFTCLLAYPMHVLFGIMSDRRGCRQVYIFGALFVAAMAFPFFWLLESRSLILMTMGYVLLINIGHNSLNAVQPSFSPDCFIRLYATAVHQLALSWGRLWQGIHAVYR